MLVTATATPRPCPATESIRLPPVVTGARATPRMVVTADTAPEELATRLVLIPRWPGPLLESRHLAPGCSGAQWLQAWGQTASHRYLSSSGTGSPGRREALRSSEFLNTLREQGPGGHGTTGEQYDRGSPLGLSPLCFRQDG